MFLDVFTMILKNSESIVFYKEMVPECKPEWNREAIMVFSRLPSLRRLQATPLLQISLLPRQLNSHSLFNVSYTWYKSLPE